MKKYFFFTVFSIVILSSGIASAETYYAEIKNGIVANVIVADKSFIDNQPGQWIQTYRDVPGKTYAGVGYHYNTTAKSFAPEPLPDYVKILNVQRQITYDALKLFWLSSPNGTASK